MSYTNLECRNFWESTSISEPKHVCHIHLQHHNILNNFQGDLVKFQTFSLKSNLKTFSTQLNFDDDCQGRSRIQREPHDLLKSAA